MEFAILGPIEARTEVTGVPLGGPKQRLLLAALLLSANEIVSRDRLVEALWGAEAPPSAHRSLDSHVSRLRRLLGAERLLRQAHGYVLRVDPGELDLRRFESLVEDARTAAADGDAPRAARLLRDALSMWRGPALADIAYEPFAALESQRLEEQRLGALEDRLDAELAIGGGPELVAELEALVRAHPWRERMLGQLMLGLYRGGRQTQALDAYQDARRRLATELGMEPGSQVRALEQRILQQDPALLAARHSAPALPRRARGRAVSLVVATLAAVAVGIVFLVGGTSGQPGAPASGSRLIGIDVNSGNAAPAIALDESPAALVADGRAVWAADADGEQVTRISAASGSVVDQIPVAGQPGSLTTGDGSIWVASTLGGTIERIDPTTDTVTQTVRLGGDHVAAIAFGAGALWAADPTRRALVEIHPGSGSVGRTIALDLRPTAVAVGRGSVWVADYDANSLEELDPASGQVIGSAHTGGGPAAIAVGPGAVWVANSLDSTVSRIDPQTGSLVATLAVGSGPSAVILTGGSVWVASQYSGTLTRIDARTNRVATTLHVGGQPSAAAAAAGKLWIGAGPDTAGHRGGTLRLVGTTPIPTLDPAFAYLAEPLQFTRLAYDTLLTFDPAPGPRGLRLVPDLAVSVPSATDANTSYTFHLRAGIRYSDGRLLKASDFRRAIERVLRTSSPGGSYYGGIVGAAACAARPAQCTLAGGVVADDRRGTVSFHLVAPDPDFPFKLTIFGYSAPIPPGTPDRDLGATPITGTGPYRLRPLRAGRVEFDRNPFFREWSHAAQPAGYPDRIVWSTVPSIDDAVEEVQKGAADWIFGLLPPRRLPSLRVSDAAQLHENPLLFIEFIPLNTHRAPFNDVRARRALNYAIDRRKIAVLYGGEDVATPTCQTVIPGMLGYRFLCPYTRASPAGAGRGGPDLARARALVAASGTRGERVEVWGSSDNVGVPRAVPAYVARVLRSLGYRTTLRMVPAGRLTEPVRRRIQLSVDGDWLPDYPDPSSYLPQFFGCGGGLSNGYVCDHALDRKMRIASSLELRAADAAAREWAGVDRRIVKQAYWVPTVNPQEAELVSKRLKNYEFSPTWDFIADQAWLR